ncbi:hypothetical protein [Humidesulfovibrio sp.]|uniref:hypothetical protein n=1 Tax=Humidesulfovibrio sp. TaxID=2910988 RepID=UPI002D80CE31|nr:hypothetical protein [Humidesulfovibrio sp.]
MGLCLAYFEEFRRHFEQSPGYVLVKAAKDGPVYRVPSERVARYPYIGINPGFYAWMHVDVDLQRLPEPAPGETPALALRRVAFDPAVYDDLNLPHPVFAVLSGRSYHLFWPLKCPLPPDPTKESVLYFRDVHRRLVRAVGGDRACGIQNIVAKNPFFPGNTAVRYASGPCTLADLRLEASPLDAPIWHAVEYIDGMRNCASFRAALAYYQKQDGVSEDELVRHLEDFQGGATDGPLSNPENEDIAKSIVQNGWRYKTRDERNYGAMGLPSLKGSGLPPEKMLAEIRSHKAEGGRYSAGLRAKKCAAAIAGALDALASAGRKLTGQAVAEAAGVDVRTVRRLLTIHNGCVAWKKTNLNHRLE